MLRSLPLRALMAASLVIAVMPLYGQSKNTYSTASQQTNGLPYSGQVVEQIVARVDDQVIDTSDYKRALSDLEQQARQQNWPQSQLDAQKKDLLRNLIDKQLLLAKGKQLGISGDDALIHRLDQIRIQNHLSSMQALQQAVEAQGLSWQDFKEQIRQNLVTEAVIRQEVAPTIRISQPEVEQYYHEHLAEFKRPEEVRLSEILIATPNPDDAKQVADAKTQADSIEAQLKAGTDFATLAKKHSSGPTAAQGGDLGNFGKGQLAPELERATFPLKEGQFTEPIRTRQGWIILKVLHHQDSGLAPISDVEVQIENAIGYQKMQPALRAYLETLRNQSYIDIRPGYSDTGATANEMKPIYSAYLPPSGKLKHKHESRVRYEAYHRGRHAGSRRTENKKEEKREHEHHHRKHHEGSYNTKPGKKEKIRFGRAPRESLPPVMGSESDQVEQGATTETSNGEEVNEQAPVEATTEQSKPKGRLDSEKNLHRKKKVKIDDHHPAPVVGKAAEANLQEQESSLGLGGNTPTKVKKTHPKEHGPKSRYSTDQLEKDAQKKKAEEEQKQQSNPASTPTDAGSAQTSGAASQQ